MIKDFTLKNFYYDLLGMKIYIPLILKVVKTNLTSMKTAFVVKQVALALR